MHKLMTVLLFVGALQLNGQKLHHVLGEVLIAIDSEIQLHNIMQDLDQIDASFKYQQITAQPMNIWKVSFDQNQVNEIIILNRLKQSKGVKFAQKNHLISYRKIPNDPRFDEQWQYINFGIGGGVMDADIDMELAWDISTGGLTAQGDTIVSCIIDDGLSPNHLDFEDNVWINNAEIPDNGIDDDNNGYIDDINGWDVYQNNADIYVGGGHGTPVTGIVGAKGNNNRGVAGVNWDIKLMIVRGGGNEANALASYAYPYSMRKKYNESDGTEGAFVVSTNASWGTDFGQPEDAPIWCSFYDSLGVVGILNCGATINGNVNVDIDGDLPTACSSEYLIAVTNMDRRDTKVTGAGYGVENIDLGAFGAETFTVASPNNYGGFGGTSGATPHVTGTIALLYSLSCDAFIETAKADPAKAALLARNYILAGVDPNASLDGITATGGRLNVNNAMLIAADECGPCKSPQNFTASTELFATSLSWTVPDDQMDASVSLRYRITADDDWTEVQNAVTPYELTGLGACTEYEVQFKSICDTLESNYIFTNSFITEGCCAANNSIIAVESSSGENIVFVDWEATEPDANYVIEYKLTKGSSWTAIETTETELSIAFDDLCTSYDIRLKTECTYDTSAYNNIVSYVTSCGECTTLPYCNSEGENDEEFIRLVQIQSLSNLSDDDNNGYGNYMGVHSTNLEQRLSYDLILAPGYSGFIYDEFFSVWIDWNQNGELEDVEKVVNSTEGSTGFYSEEITVPNDALLGYTRMRVVMSSNQDPGACGTGFANFGETEDYCINIKEHVQDCNFTINFISAEPTFTSATIRLSENIDLDKIIYRYKVLISGDDWTEAESDVVNFDISNLIQCTTYEFQYKTVCTTNTTEYSDSQEFETLCPSAVLNIKDLGIEVSPNPFYESLVISSDLEIQDIEIHDLNGRSISSFDLSRMGEKFEIKNTQDLSTGVYILKFTLKNGDVASKSVVKM